MVKMVPGVPFVYFLNSDTSHPYTLSCIQTLASLCPYHDFPEILDASVRLAKLTWGCDSNVPPIRPLGHLEGLKHNDRSKSIAPDLPPGSHDGSYSLATTVLKGTGQGTVIPATQVNTEEGGPQITAVLKMLNELHKQIMPKCISRFEYEVAKFHSEDMNVVGFGGLEPNGTGCQFNLSSLCSHLSKRLGLGNSTGTPMGIAPATCTRPVQYPYSQPHGFSHQNEPKNVEIGQEMRELWLISMNFTKSAITPSVFVRKLRFWARSKAHG